MSGSDRQAITAYIALGANLGDPAATLLKAMEALAALGEVALVKRSSLYRTVPVESSGPDYVNAVVEILTTLTAPSLLDQLLHLEQAAGRERPYRNAPRVLDLDVLTYGEASVTSTDLVIPHPRMNERAFVLVPLAEIAPHKVSAERLQSVQTQSVELLLRVQ